MVCGLSLQDQTMTRDVLKLELPHSHMLTQLLFPMTIKQNVRLSCIRLPSDTQAPLSDSELSKTKSISEEKDDKFGNVEPNKTEQTAKKYDESLFKALHHTFFK